MSCQIWWFLHKYILRNLREHPDFHKKNHICIWIQHSLLAETLWNKYAESHFLVFLVFFFFLGSLQGFVSPKAPAAYVTPSPRILRFPSRCLAYHLATLYFLCWCCTLFYAFFNSLWIPSPGFHLGTITHSEPNLLYDSVLCGSTATEM